MTTPLITVRISGQAMSIIEGSELNYDPVKYDGGTQGARDAYEGLQAPQARRAGRGWTYTVDTTVDGATALEKYCRTVGETFAGELDPETRADGRALLKVAASIAALVKLVDES